MHDNVRSKLPKVVIKQLEDLEDQVIKLMKKSIQVGQTFIITNAGQGWVELSSLRFLPRLHSEIINQAHKLGL
jgi:hypothetical protein